LISKYTFEDMVKVELEAAIGRAEINALASRNRNLIYNENANYLTSTKTADNTASTMAAHSPSCSERLKLASQILC
jgi:hypothetical protein